jgi:hypothetical protein
MSEFSIARRVENPVTFSVHSSIAWRAQFPNTPIRRRKRRERRGQLLCCGNQRSGRLFGDDVTWRVPRQRPHGQNICVAANRSILRKGRRSRSGDTVVRHRRAVLWIRQRLAEDLLCQPPPDRQPRREQFAGPCSISGEIRGFYWDTPDCHTATSFGRATTLAPNSVATRALTFPVYLKSTRNNAFQRPASSSIAVAGS